MCFWMLLLGCTPPLHMQLQFGECKLKKIRVDDKASYFQLFSHPHTHLLEFYWESPWGAVVTTLPLKKFSFMLDDNKQVPTVKFVFNDTWAYKYSERCYIKEEDKLSYVNSDYLTGVQVRISRSDWEEIAPFFQSKNYEESGKNQGQPPLIER